MTRVAVFVDYQNVYMGAREAFGLAHGQPSDGQINPMRLGLLLCNRGRQIDPDRELEAVHIFRGEPSAVHSVVGQAACQRQVAAWAAMSKVIPVTRPLKYYAEGPPGPQRRYTAREKGIDVLLALAMARGAARNEFDVAVLFSADTDLMPAIEAVRAEGKRCEVAGWVRPNGQAKALKQPGLWCHKLNRHDYDQYLHDPTDYRRAAP